MAAEGFTDVDMIGSERELSFGCHEEDYEEADVVEAMARCVELSRVDNRRLVLKQTMHKKCVSRSRTESIRRAGAKLKRSF